jgi:hypothetical protein
MSSCNIPKPRALLPLFSPRIFCWPRDALDQPLRFTPAEDFLGLIVVRLVGRFVLAGSARERFLGTCSVASAHVDVGFAWVPSAALASVTRALSSITGSSTSDIPSAYLSHLSLKGWVITRAAAEAAVVAGADSHALPVVS